ncbi:hypothetical protein CROQUDRAFT_100467 [Cronartium quercuum f. sp. fusiforme G11]|uniref:Uncharacterized protein n=1 Tax=Cronartium quercuum f. sp. fusiforme G11 TaxID=708437 RepID=A0A9P6N754_9BASI|nr:hypothetical protein CROQUDRAFT_100467 [Cronartium quercuum f. sp. fusiforme G11]
MSLAVWNHLENHTVASMDTILQNLPKVVDQHDRLGHIQGFTATESPEQIIQYPQNMMNMLPYDTFVGNSETLELTPKFTAQGSMGWDYGPGAMWLEESAGGINQPPLGSLAGIWSHPIFHNDDWEHKHLKNFCPPGTHFHCEQGLHANGPMLQEYDKTLSPQAMNPLVYSQLQLENNFGSHNLHPIFSSQLKTRDEPQILVTFRH